MHDDDFEPLTNPAIGTLQPISGPVFIDVNSPYWSAAFEEAYIKPVADGGDVTITTDVNLDGVVEPLCEGCSVILAHRSDPTGSTQTYWYAYQFTAFQAGIGYNVDPPLLMNNSYDHDPDGELAFMAQTITYPPANVYGSAIFLETERDVLATAGTYFRVTTDQTEMNVITALHELGHLLGLEHGGDASYIMNTPPHVSDFRGVSFGPQYLNQIRSIQKPRY